MILCHPADKSALYEETAPSGVIKKFFSDWRTSVNYQLRPCKAEVEK